MEVCTGALATGCCVATTTFAGLPVMCRNLPLSVRWPFAALLTPVAPEPGLRLFAAPPAAFGGAALACPQRSSPQINVCLARTMTVSVLW